MAEKPEISRSDFEKLLVWLHPDKDTASRKYEQIRTVLIRIFLQRGYSDAEDMSDEVIDRVTKKIGKLEKDYEGDPALYFYGVAKRLALESSKNVKTEELPLNLQHRASIQTASEEKAERDALCLDKCLDNLPPESRKLILGYYQYDQESKLRSRKRLAEMFELSENALRIKTARVRKTLHKCLLRCLSGHGEMF